MGAEAPAGQVSLESVPRELVLCVQYGGKGISLVQDRRGDPGVPTMGYRAPIIGGRLSIGHVEGGSLGAP